MKTIISLTSFFVAVGASSAALIKGPINIGASNDCALGFETEPHPVISGLGSDAWLSEVAGADTGLMWADDHRNDHSWFSFAANHPQWIPIAGTPHPAGDVTSLNLTDGGRSNGHGFNRSHHTDTVRPQVQIDSISSPSQQVPDGGDTVALLGLSLLSLGSARAILRRSC